jgi:hypothetical protein
VTYRSNEEEKTPRVSILNDIQKQYLHQGNIGIFDKEMSPEEEMPRESVVQP